MKVDYRWSIVDDEFMHIDAKIGMVIAEKVDENGKYREPRTFPHYDFSYVIFEVREDGVNTRDTAQNNLWWLSAEELNGYELVREWHPNGDDGVADWVNEALGINNGHK